MRRLSFPSTYTEEHTREITSQIIKTTPSINRTLELWNSEDLEFGKERQDQPHLSDFGQNNKTVFVKESDEGENHLLRRERGIEYNGRGPGFGRLHADQGKLLSPFFFPPPLHFACFLFASTKNSQNLKPLSQGDLTKLKQQQKIVVVDKVPITNILMVKNLNHYIVYITTDSIICSFRITSKGEIKYDLNSEGGCSPGCAAIQEENSELIVGKPEVKSRENK